MKFIIGKKIEMTQLWRGDDMIAVTRVQAGPCVVVQVKEKKKDGYEAVQIGYGEKKEKNIKKPQKGHLKKLKIKNEKFKINLRYLKEFRIVDKEAAVLKAGDVIDVNTFAAGDIVKVTGTSKGKGFAGVVKRHGFHGHNATHGTKDQVRMPGSIGAGGVQRVFKGKRMGGHMGAARVTTSNLEIIEVDKENNILLIKGAVPGARNSLVMISGKGELKTISNEQLTINNKKEEDKVEEIVEAVEAPVVEEAKNEEEIKN
jgi:large subunit ribosomal protein L3